MADLLARRGAALRRCGWMLALALLGMALPSAAIEFAEGRVQIHGFGEMQIRALDEKFQQELDLAQWYNVINLELEVDIAPDGWGPFDLVSAYVRAEGRYDAIYSHGFGMFQNVNTFGDDAERLPLRLRDAIDTEYGGTIPATDRFGNYAAYRIQNEEPAPFKPQGERLGFPGFDTFFRQLGPDNVSGPLPTSGPDNPRTAMPAPNLGVVKLGQPSDDPAEYVHQKLLGYKFAFKDFRGPANNTTQILGPWLPKNFIRAIAINPDVGNPFRGRLAPSALRNPSGVVLDSAIRFYQSDPTLVVPAGQTAVVDRLDPMLAQLKDAGPSIRSYLINGANQVVLGATLASFFPSNRTTGFGGDFMGGIAPCVDPTNSDFKAQREARQAPPAGARCIRASLDTSTNPAPTLADVPNLLYTDPNILGVTKITGGTGETPFKPAPDIGNLGRVIVDQNGNVVGNSPDSFHQNLELAQGLYYPSQGLKQELASGHLNSLPFNFDQVDRSWNRGDSQEDTKELKEAYVDIEMLDSRLWMRLGLQNIVWGKTELFRTTDQFNPQDLALASLPSLEESRIALWSARFVYSLYSVGPAEDVRLEFAANIDGYQNSDLGACGEPFTPDIVCSLTTGLWAHSLLGVGVAGIDRPESPWKDPGDLELGGRLEWRWDRFSFAVTDFYGFSDFPFPDAIFFYERAVDPASGRPLVARLPGQALGTCGVANGGEVVPRGFFGQQIFYSTGFASHPLSMTPGSRDASGNPLRGGIGRDPDCLRPGGARGEANQFRFDQPEDRIDQTNALQHHHANQQIYSWICAGTVGIAAQLDASACAWTIFASQEVLSPQFLPFPFVELLTPVLAGEQTGGSGGPMQFLGLTQNSQKYPAADVTAPLAAMNRLPNPFFSPIYDRNKDGQLNAVGCNDPDPNVRYDCDLRGFDAFDTRVTVVDRVNVPTTLDNTLTNEQRALLGCGPFYGTRCDTAAASGIYGVFGGVDFLNMEASALVQSWPGFEGTVLGHTTTSPVPIPGVDKPLFNDVNGNGVQDPGELYYGPAVAQPGTVGFVGGPTCTRFVASQGTVKLPGCRGIASLEVVPRAAGNPPVIQIQFEPGYLPSIDGCVIGDRVFDSSTGQYAQVAASYTDKASTSVLTGELALCSRATSRRPVAQFNSTILPNGGVSQVLNPNCTGQPAGGSWQNVDYSLCNGVDVALEMLPLIHPVAGCIESNQWFANGGGGQGGCEFFYQRNLTQEFFNGTAALFQNELAAFSWNFLMFLTITSCNATAFDLDGLNHTIPQFPSAEEGLRTDPQCFDANNPWTPGRCSYQTPQYCSNVKGFLSAAGVTRNVVRAGGNGAYGRRTFIWHGGGEVVLRYEQRNVLGFSTDFAEDVTKTNWGVEFTWIDDVPFQDNGTALGIRTTDAYNLTVSVDRPTFINFLNPNRTFFFNSQWFFNYLPGYNKDFTSNGPVNVLFTFAMFTGYFQDRVNPQFVTVYDFGSKSGGLLPSLQYRFTESFSVTVGMLWFFGYTQFKNMPVQEFAPPSDRVGKHANKIGVDNTLSLIRKRDEVFLRLRWTF